MTDEEKSACLANNAPQPATGPQPVHNTAPQPITLPQAEFQAFNKALQPITGGGGVSKSKARREREKAPAGQAGGDIEMDAGDPKGVATTQSNRLLHHIRLP